MTASARHKISKELLLLQVNSECKLVDNAGEQRVKWSFIWVPRGKIAMSANYPRQWLAHGIRDGKRLRLQLVDVETTRA